MKIFTTKSLIITLPLILSSIVTQQAQAVDNDATAKSLDSMTEQSSEIPDLLMEKPISHPEAERISSPEPKSEPVNKIAGYRLQTLQAQTDAMNAQLSIFKAEQEKKIAELAKQYASIQDANAKALETQQNKLVESEQKQVELQTKWQSASQQLESANKQIAELSAARQDEETEAIQLRQSLAESQKQTDVLTEKVAALTAQQQQFTDGEKQRIELQTKWQSTSQQLESANKQIAELTAARQDEGGEVVQLKQSLSDSQNESVALTEKITVLTTEQAAKVNELAVMKKALEESEDKRTELQTKWEEATTSLDAKAKQMASLNSVSETPAPVSQEEIRAYALGAFWGHDVLNAMKNVEADGFKVLQPQVISGITDMMSGKFKIPKEKMLEELKEMDASAASKAMSAGPADNDNKSYIVKYSKKPGVKKAEMGYYYRITKKGRGAIKDTDTVAIAVTESLTNGKVIKDMNKERKVLVLPLDKFPPLFKTALINMNNHGKLRMVVPPELAYGEAGSPPNIPPNATMVYDINVVNVSPTE